MNLLDELSRRGIQYGIHKDGSVVLFAGDKRFPIADNKMALGIIDAYQTEVEYLDRLFDAKEEYKPRHERVARRPKAHPRRFPKRVEARA